MSGIARAGHEFRVAQVDIFERPVRLRLPFRFGVVTLTACPQAFVRARIVFPDGGTSSGAAAELMVPKWFDKAPGKSDERNVEDLRMALSLAADAYLSDSGTRCAFLHSALHHVPIRERAGRLGANQLTAAYGPAVLDRAILDALCRHRGVSMFAAVRANLPGIEAQPLTPDLAGFDLNAFLARLQPRETIAARHTVGLLDPITSDEVTRRVEDGLPESLEEVIRTYGHRWFKVKVQGDLRADLDRLTRIASVLDARCEDYSVTLDGNEQYADVQGIVELWRAVGSQAELQRFARSVITIEQPVPRHVALRTSIEPLARYKGVLIDESDSSYDAFLEARSVGYTGVSSKSCKGLYRSLLNSARSAHWSVSGNHRYFLSAEDLTMQAGLGVQQDLALVGLLGLTHVERNGHHYVNGFSGAGAADAEQDGFLAAHPPLYERSFGSVRLKIRNGSIDLRSLGSAGFASGAEPDWSTLSDARRSV